MKNTINYLIPVLFLSTLVSCLEGIPIEVDRVDGQLVVTGYISDLQENYVVELSSITNFDGTGTFNAFVSNARLEIIEIGGNTHDLIEVANGKYQTQGDFFGSVGGQYQLRITLATNEVYESRIETIPEKVQVSSGEAVFRESISENLNGSNTVSRGHELILTIANTEEDHFYIIENLGWVEAEMVYGDCGFGNPPPTTPTVCWALRDPIVTSELIINTNQRVSAGDYTISTLTVPLDFKGEYIANLRLNAMSSENYAFWNDVSDQLNRSGSIFDRPFAPVIGNITHVNGNKVALGYFHAYASSQTTICFDRSEILGSVTIPGPISCSTTCVEVFAPATFDDVSEFLCP